MEGNNYTHTSVIILVISFFLILPGVFLGFAFFDREPIQYEDMAFTVETGKAYRTFHNIIEDGYEFGFILPESTSNISFTLVISIYTPVRSWDFNYGKMINSSEVIEEFRGDEKISVQAEDYYYYNNVYLYITNTGDLNEGKVINAQYFEQRGALASRTGTFEIVLLYFAMFWVIIYGSMRREIKMKVRDYKRAILIKWGKLEAAPSVTNEPEKAFDFVFKDRYD
jgi:hypothetical protein